jgi:hypothetical protein
MAKKVAEKFQGENLFAPFNPFYEQRHTVLHYPKVPMRRVGNILAAPRLGDKPKEWGQGMRWSDLRQCDIKFLAENIECTLRELEKVINTFLFRITQLAASQKGFVPIQWPEMVAQGRNVSTNYLSSSNGIDSGQHPIPGSSVAFGPSTENPTALGARDRMVSLSGVAFIPSTETPTE